MEILKKAPEEQPVSATLPTDSSRARTVKSLLLAFLLLSGLNQLGGSSRLWAQTRPASTTFFVETIRIENVKRAQLDVILTESRLQTDRSYSEAELQNSRNRIVQLPFIKGADLSFERGSEPGKLVLVIQIVETKTWFLALDFSGETFSDDVSSTATESTATTAKLVNLFGRQFFLGRTGVLTTALGGKAGDLHLQYTQYDLFGRGIGLSSTYAVGFCDDDPAEGNEVCSTGKVDLATDPTFAIWSRTGDQHRLTTSLTVPLSPSLSLLTEVDFRHTEEGFKRPALNPRDGTSYRYESLEELEIQLGGLRDTLDDPVAPMSGQRLELAIVHRRTTGTFELGLSAIPQAPTFDTTILESGATASLIRYWPKGRYSLFTTGDFYVGYTQWKNLPIEDKSSLSGNATALRAAVGLGHAVELWRSTKPGNLANIRLETDVTAFWDGTSPSSNLSDEVLPKTNGFPSLETNPLKSMRLRSALVFRNRRVVLRFSLAYRELFVP